MQKKIITLSKRQSATTETYDNQKPATTSKDFLPMTTTPCFDAIPQDMKIFRRWLCWQLQPADPKPKKVPMSPKNGRLVNAAVNKPENWLTFDEAISYFNRGLCSGIGFVLTNETPKVCCVDVDHCFNPDETLSDEAKSIIALCDNSWVEKSQSGTGIHVWFIDDGFSGGRKKGNVEVYTTDRYIAMTGNHLADTAPEIKTVNGACKAVIRTYIDADIDNPSLFDKPARAIDEKTNSEIENAAPMTDDDRRLVDYFRSDKSRESDLNMFNLFSGNIAEYFKTQGKLLDDSVADEHLMLKILYYAGGSGNDDEIKQRAFRLFDQSELAKRSKWVDRKDYRLRTLNSAFEIWVKNGRKTIKATPHDNKIAALKAELREVNKAIAAFDAQKGEATQKLRDVETFNSKTVFSEEIITAAAFANLFDKQTFSDFRRDVKNYGDKHKEEKASVRDWLADVKDRVAEIRNQETDLTTRFKEIQAEIDSLSFVESHDALKNLVIPRGYSVSAEHGIVKVDGKISIPVCVRPVIITGKSYSVDEKTYKVNLAYMTGTGQLRELPPTEMLTISDRNKIVALSNNGLPVTSNNAACLVDYLYLLNALNENSLPLTYVTNRCGWYEFDGKKHFIDPRRPCVIQQDDDKPFSVKVEDSRSEFAKHLKKAGDIEEWKRAYQLAKKSPVARFSVAAAVAPPLLNVLGERNFLLYIYAPTRAGKTTALTLAASAVGDEKIIRSFDATKNGLAGAAADVNDYPFLIDEKQVADDRLKDQFNNLVYALANGLGRTKLNKDSTLKKLQDWRTIAIMTGEAPMLSDNATGGAYTRLLTIKAPKEILHTDDCKTIRDTTKGNYGFALPLVVNEIFKHGENVLRENFAQICTALAEARPEILPEYRRYLAVVSLADTLLNAALFGNKTTAPDGEIIKALDDAITNAGTIASMIPTTTEISDTTRGKAFVRDFIAQNQNRFIGGSVDIAHMKDVLGRINSHDGYIYITVPALKDACKYGGFDYRKLVADLISDGFFVPNDTTKKGCKKPLDTVQKKLGELNATCYRIPQSEFDADEEEHTD